MNTTPACAILAGGKNKRMGTDKAFLQINGTPIIQKTITLLKQLFQDIIIVTNSPSQYAQYERDTTVITDKIKSIGPLGGIFSALSYYTAKESVFFVACDMPFLHNDMIQRQLTCFNRINCDALIPKTGSFIEPLHAIYKTSLKNSLFEFIKNNTTYSIRSFLQNINVKYMHLENTPYIRRVFKNINTPQDLKKCHENSNKIKNLV